MLSFEWLSMGVARRLRRRWPASLYGEHEAHINGTSAAITRADASRLPARLAAR